MNRLAIAVCSAAAGALLAYFLDAEAGARRRARAGRRLGEALHAPGLTNSVRVQRSLHVGAPVEHVYAFWRDARNYARALRHVREVRGDLAGTSEWRVGGDGSAPLQWQARSTALVEHLLIGWETLPGADLRHAGTLRFEDCADGSTRLHLELVYEPPDGALADAVTPDAVQRLLDDELQRARRFIEGGRPPRDDAAFAPESGEKPEVMPAV